MNDYNNLDYLNISQENLLLQNSQESPLKISILKNSKVFIGNAGFKDLSNFSLQKITDVYSSFSNGKEVYFLNSLGDSVKVKSIEKVPYSGKIYDVDVEN